MILVRMLFQVKFGRMDEVLAGMKQLRPITAAIGLPPSQILTDLGGLMFTLVQEIEVESLEQRQRQTQELFSNPEWQAMSARMPDVFESGRTEFYTIHDM